MNFLKIAWRDILSIFKNRFIRVSVLGIIIVPLLYSLLYLAAFWDPYSKLTSMHVAVVNMDEGGVKDSNTVNYGDYIVKNLKDNKELGWKFVSLKDAQDGVKGNKYYSMFVIPKDFSMNVLSAKDGKPQEAKIIYISNDKKNFIASQIGSKVELIVKDEISKNIIKEYTEVAFDNLYEVKDGFAKAVDGSKKLNHAIAAAKDGSTQIMSGLGTLNEKVPELKDGTNKLYNGSVQLFDGINTTAIGKDGNPLGLKSGVLALAKGLNDAKTKSISLTDGIGQIYKGSKDIGNGINSLNTAVNVDVDAAHPSLKTGVATLYDGITNTDPSKGLGAGVATLYGAITDPTKGLGTGVKQLASSTSELKDLVRLYNYEIDPVKKGIYLAEISIGIDQLNTGMQNLNTAVNIGTTSSQSLVKGVAALNTAVNVGTAVKPSLVAGITAINNGVSTQLAPGVKALNTSVNIGTISTPSFISGMSRLNDGVAQLTPGLSAASDGATSILAGVDKLSEGSVQLKDGLSALNANVPALANGIDKLFTGSKDLNEGMSKLTDGSKELTDKLAEGSDKMNKNLVTSSKDMATFVSEPVKISEQPINPVKNYGTGFTPYFIPLSLWVGALMMFFVITDKIDNDLKASSASVVAGKFLSYSCIGIIQAILVSTVVLFLGLKPQNYVIYYAFNIFMSFVFIAIIQSLVFLLGEAGRLIAIALLILQLTSCAGTFPIEVVPKFFKVLNPFMPFTYCVSALREIISGTDYIILTKDVTALALIMFGFLMISMLMKEHADKVQALIAKKKEDAASAA